MRIDHIGYAVKRIDRAMDSFQKLGFHFETVIEDAARNVKISFGEKDGYRIELVSPLDKKSESPVDAYLSKIGPTPYHICYQTDNLEKSVGQLQKEGFRKVTEPAEAIAFGNRKVVFLTSLGTGLMEFVEI